jgi:isochorismate synthase
VIAAAERLPSSRQRALAAGLAAAAPGDRLSRIALPASLVAPAALLAASVADDVAVLWEPRARVGDGTADDWKLAGAGAAITLRASGEGRLAAIAAAAQAVWSRVADAAIGEPPLRFVGGLSFAPGAWTTEWAGLGDAWFVLPRWTYARRGDQAWLVLTVTGDEAADAARWLAELDDVDAALAHPPHVPPARLIAIREADDAAWTQQIADIQGAIAGGQVAKVVAARASVVEVEAPIAAAAVLGRLAERHADCTRFAVRADGATFAGATPERLVRQRGRVVETDALAGSIARPAPGNGNGDADAAQALLASSKDRWEHDLVVRAIADTLAPRCADLQVPSAPVVHALRQILHLHTPISGRLAAAGHILDLVGALHPTPAVGGTPTAEAVRWIADHEAPRGWYAAPVGWFDASGDGDFAVAIRSGLLAGSRATVWAGAGIVRDSDAAAELAEVRLKQRALLGALGVL